MYVQDNKGLARGQAACSERRLSSIGWGFKAIECSRRNTSSARQRLYNSVMTAKTKKAKRKKAHSRPGRVGRLHASVEDDLLLLADEETGADSRWNRPRKQRLSLRVDTEVVDWFKSKGPGYQTRINRILRRVMTEGKKHSTKR
jgi:uncharacterized protein (DUF4415 family)